MLIGLNDIPPRGLAIEEDASPAQLLIDPEDHVLGPVSLSLWLDRSGTQVRVTGHAHARLATQCHRCNDPFELDLDAELDVCFQPVPESGLEDVGPDAPLGLCFYSGELIDLGPVVRDALLLAAPMVHLCREDCGAICPDCGDRRLPGGRCECTASRQRAMRGNPFAEFFRQQTR